MYLLPVPGVAIPVRIGFLTANERTVLCASIPTHALFMIDAAIRIEPHDDIRRAVGLSRSFRVELLHLAAGSRRRGSRSVVRPCRGGCREKAEPDD